MIRDATSLVVPVHVAHLVGGRLDLLVGAHPMLLEIGSSDRQTMDIDSLPSLPNASLVTLEPLIDKYARALGRRLPAQRVRDSHEPLGRHHARGIVLPMAVAEAPPGGEQRTLYAGGA